MRYFWKKLQKNIVLVRINTLCGHLQTRFNRNLDQNMLKNALFFWKNRFIFWKNE